jgi:heat shock protein HslJ
MRSIPLLGLLAVMTLLAGCSSTGAASPLASGVPGGAAAPATADALAGRMFLATESEGTKLVEGSQVRLTFEVTRIGASAGCNQMSGEYGLTDGVLRVGQMAMTEMACEEPLMAQDAWLAGFLPGATASIDGTTLTLTKDGTTVTLEDQPQAGRLGVPPPRTGVDGTPLHGVVHAR